MTPGLYPNPLGIIFSKDPPGEVPTTSQPESGLKMHLSPKPSIKQMGKPGGRAGNWVYVLRTLCSCFVAPGQLGLSASFRWMRP